MVDPYRSLSVAPRSIGSKFCKDRRLVIRSSGPTSATGTDSTRADQLQYGGPRLKVEADPGQLEQLLINLVKNALEAVDRDDGEVSLSWRKQQPSPDRGHRQWAGLAGKRQSIPAIFYHQSQWQRHWSGVVSPHRGSLILSNRESGGCRALHTLPGQATPPSPEHQQQHNAQHQSIGHKRQ